MEDSWDWCTGEFRYCHEINLDLKRQNGSRKLSEDGH